METKHTPGPWMIAESDERFVYALNEKGFNRFCAQVQDAHTDISELQANARLIAAAPELLEALNRAVMNYGHVMNAQDRKFIGEAIAKATGASHE